MRSWAGFFHPAHLLVGSVLCGGNHGGVVWPTSLPSAGVEGIAASPLLSVGNQHTPAIDIGNAARRTLFVVDMHGQRSNETGRFRASAGLFAYGAVVVCSPRASFALFQEDVDGVVGG